MTDTPNGTTVRTRVTIDGESFFPAIVDRDDTWNGFLSPRFDRATAERVAEHINAIGDPAEGDHLSFSGSLLYIDGDRVQYVRPGDDGLYAIGAHCWTWMECEGVDFLGDGETELDERLPLAEVVACYNCGTARRIKAAGSPCPECGLRSSYRLSDDDPISVAVSLCVDCVLVTETGELWDGNGNDTSEEHSARISEAWEGFDFDRIDNDGEGYFSWRSCDGCGSTLGGLREDYLAHRRNA